MISSFFYTFAGNTRSLLFLMSAIAGSISPLSFAMQAQSSSKKSSAADTSGKAFITTGGASTQPEEFACSLGQTPPLRKYLFGDDRDAKDAYTEFIAEIMEKAQEEAKDFFCTNFPEQPIDTDVVHHLAKAKGAFDALTLAQTLENPQAFLEKRKLSAKEDYAAAIHAIRIFLKERHSQQEKNAPPNWYVTTSPRKKTPEREAKELLKKFVNAENSVSLSLLLQQLASAPQLVDKR